MERVEGQCPHCGRMPIDWSKEGRGTTKGVIHPHAREDRTFAYRKWKRSLGGGLYATDIDQVEWRRQDDALVPVALLELSRVDGGMRLPQTYLEGARVRIEERDPQGRQAQQLAFMLGIPVYFVLFRATLKDFWVRELFSDEKWLYLNQRQYVTWLRSLLPPKGAHNESDAGI